MPLSMEKLSDGRPAMVHAQIFTGSPREFIRHMFGEQGISLLLQRVIHSSVWSWREAYLLNTILPKDHVTMYVLRSSVEFPKKRFKFSNYSLSFRKTTVGQNVSPDSLAVPFSVFAHRRLHISTLHLFKL